MSVEHIVELQDLIRRQAGQEQGGDRQLSRGVFEKLCRQFAGSQDISEEVTEPIALQLGGDAVNRPVEKADVGGEERVKRT